MKSLDRRTRKILKLYCAFFNKGGLDKDTGINSTKNNEVWKKKKKQKKQKKNKKNMKIYFLNKTLTFASLAKR